MTTESDARSGTLGTAGARESAAGSAPHRLRLTGSSDDERQRVRRNPTSPVSPTNPRDAGERECDASEWAPPPAFDSQRATDCGADRRHHALVGDDELRSAR